MEVVVASRKDLLRREQPAGLAADALACDIAQPGLRPQLQPELAGVSKDFPPTNMEVQKGQLIKRKVVFLQGSVHKPMIAGKRGWSPTLAVAKTTP